MVPKLIIAGVAVGISFRAVLFRMVPKYKLTKMLNMTSFRAVLFRMVPKQSMLDKEVRRRF